MSMTTAVSGALVIRIKVVVHGPGGTTPAKFVDIEWSTNKPRLLSVPLNAMDNLKLMWDSVETKFSRSYMEANIPFHVWQSCRLQYISFVKINIHSPGHALF